MNDMTNPIRSIDKKSIIKIAERLAANDEMLGAVFEELGPPPLWKRPATFATFIRIILEQQVSLASARSTFDRLQATCDGKIDARSVSSLGEARLRSLGFTRQKARYASVLANDVLSKTFQIGSLRHQEDSVARAMITDRLGMGEWTADVFLMMALLRSDLFPVGDLALVNGLQELENHVYPSKEQILQRAEVWRPYRSVAARMIWHSYLHRRAQKVP